jgi:hypothetical protein
MTKEVKQALLLGPIGLVLFGGLVFGGIHLLEQRRVAREEQRASDEATSKVIQKALKEDRAARAAQEAKGN